MQRATYAPIERRHRGDLPAIDYDACTRPAEEVISETRAALERHKARMNRLDAERAAQAELYRGLA
jgi:hypothetical protein